MLSTITTTFTSRKMSNKVIIKTASTSLIVILIGLLGAAAFWLRINADKLRKEREITEQLSGNYRVKNDDLKKIWADIHQKLSEW